MSHGFSSMETASRAVLYYTYGYMTTRRNHLPIVAFTLTLAALVTLACSSDSEPKQEAVTPTATAIVSALVPSEPIDPNAPQVIYTGVGFVPKRLDIETLRHEANAGIDDLRRVRVDRFRRDQRADDGRCRRSHSLLLRLRVGRAGERDQRGKRQRERNNG